MGAQCAGWLGEPRLQRWVRDLNQIYRSDPRLHELDAAPDGFAWVDPTNQDGSIVSFLHRDRRDCGPLLFACNFAAGARHPSRVGVPVGGSWAERLNSDAACYGGSGQGNLGGLAADTVPHHRYPQSLELTVPPLSVLVLAPTGRRDKP